MSHDQLKLPLSFRRLQQLAALLGGSAVLLLLIQSQYDWDDVQIDLKPCATAAFADVSVYLGASVRDRSSQTLYGTFHEHATSVLARSVRDVFHVQTILNGRFLYPTQEGRGHFSTVASWWEAANNSRYYWPPRGTGDLASCDYSPNGTVVVFRGFSFLSFQYGHVLHDLLPVLVWMAASFPQGKLAVELDDKKKIKAFLRWFDPDLKRRAFFIEPEKVVCATTLLAVVPNSCCSSPQYLRIPQLFNHLKQRISRTHVWNEATQVVYEIRLPNTAEHGRLLSSAHSEEVLQLAKKMLRYYSLPDDVIEFDGTSRGATASFQEQFRIFNSAYLVFGPHGTGFSNIIWMRCDQPVAVIEFVCGAHSRNVRGCLRSGAGFATYWTLLGGAQWVRYFHVFVQDTSTEVNDFMEVDLLGFSMALRAALTNITVERQTLKKTTETERLEP
ncbi:Carbonic anhydrase [Durusdinium trenchii]|uniref:Carbonic anhydrase n=1 Tax=Durusdinium trenchii TaxID=1381693 RepID=A0ABP0R2G4_9DINO